MLRRFAKLSTAIGLILLLGFGLSSCAFEKLIFERLDWFAMYQIDGYLDLDKKQKLKLKPTISEAIAWLKKEQIPGALKTLEKLELAAKNHTYNDEVSSAFTDDISQVRKAMAVKYEKAFVDTLVSLSDEQVQYLAKKLRKGNENLEEAAKDDDPDAYDSILKRQRKTLNEYYGSLSDAQEKEFYSTMRLDKTQIQRRLSERKKVQDHIIAVLSTHDRSKITELVRTFGETGEVIQDKSYVEFRLAQKKSWEAYLIGFHKSLSREQWLHLEEKMREYRTKLSDLAGM